MDLCPNNICLTNDLFLRQQLSQRSFVQKSGLYGQMDKFRVADQPERAKKGSSNSKGVLPGAFFDQVTFLLSFEESSMHPQDHDCSIIRLTSSRKFVHKCEDRVDHVVSALFTAFGRCPSEALYAPLLVGRIYCFNDPVSVGEDQVARIKLNRAFLIGPIRKHSDGCAAGFKPNDRAVSSNEHRRIVACIHIS